MDTIFNDDVKYFPVKNAHFFLFSGQFVVNEEESYNNTQQGEDSVFDVFNDEFMDFELL